MTATTKPKPANKGPDPAALDQLVETLAAIAEEREENELIWGSMIKQAIKRRNPRLNERAHGFGSFNDLLVEAQKRNLITLKPDEKSGGYIVQMVDKSPSRGPQT